MTSVFEPLEIADCGDSMGSGVSIRSDGLSMELPAIGPLGGLLPGYARGGRSLFRPHDAALAGELVYMLEHGFESLAAYRKGVLEERGRIARDMHDNIGAGLLGALHSPDADVKDLKIRESLADLRKVINDIVQCSRGRRRNFGGLEGRDGRAAGDRRDATLMDRRRAGRRARLACRGKRAAIDHP